MNPGSVLVLEKTFVRPFSGVVRGVESFNLRLVRDMAAAGWRVCAPADGTWAGPLGEAARAAASRGGGAGGAVQHVPVRGGGAPALALFRAALAAVREARRAGGPFDWLLLANDANGLAVPARAVLAAGAARRLLIFAHKLPYPYFLRVLGRRADRVVCVSDAVAAGFREAGFADKTFVQYGVADAAAWHPPETPRAGSGPLRFCVFGSLDSEWKGADTALAAWRLLPEGFRRENELHLVAYSSPPDFRGEPGVVAHGWRDPATLPEMLRGMDVLLAPSRDPKRLMETFSQCVVQGMLTGLPVVHTPIPVFAEKFDAGGGIAAETPAAFAAAMLRLAGDPALRARLGAEARRTALARYVWDYPRFDAEHLRPRPAGPTA